MTMHELEATNIDCFLSMFIMIYANIFLATGSLVHGTVCQSLLCPLALSIHLKVDLIVSGMIKMHALIGTWKLLELETVVKYK